MAAIDAERIIRGPKIPTREPNTTSAAEYFLQIVQENISKGYTKWLTNSARDENVMLADVEPFSRKVASALSKRGMGPGDVGLYLTSDVTRIYTILVGAWRIGGIMYSSYPNDTYDTLVERLKEAKARWIFCDTDSVQRCKRATTRVEWPVEIFVFGPTRGETSVDELFLDNGDACPEKVPNRGLDDPILIMCTSGTTGRCKGAVHTNRSMLSVFVMATSLIIPGNTMLFLGRCTNFIGITIAFRNACVGGHILMMHENTQTNILRSVAVYKPTVAMGYPKLLFLLCRDIEGKPFDLSSVKRVFTGGMFVPGTFYTEMMKLPSVQFVTNGFGSTETGSLTTSIDEQGVLIPNVPRQSVGRLLPNMELKVIDLDTGLTLGPMEQGELAIKTPCLASYYWERPEDSALAFFDNGWMRTGDIGYYDENGYIFLIGRIKESFKCNSLHISPTELESEILQHPAVAEAAVFGVTDPTGEDYHARALVVLKEGQNVSAKEIKSFAEVHLSEFKHFRGGLFIVDSLPKGPTGKVIKSEAAKIIVEP